MFFNYSMAKVLFLFEIRKNICIFVAKLKEYEEIIYIFNVFRQYFTCTGSQYT